MRGFGCLLAVGACSLFSMFLAAQDVPIEQEAPRGKVLFSRGTNEPDVKRAQPSEQKSDITPAVTDAERQALTVTSYDLDLHLTPARAGLAARVGLTMRNDGPSSVSRLVVQVSSSLRWEGFTGNGQRLEFATERVETDADHTGAVSEAVVKLPEPLAAGETVQVIGVYSGAVGRSLERLKRIGAPADQSERADWDEIATSEVALRGFGEVVWYPVAAAPVFLGDGAKFFQAVGRARVKVMKATAKLRLAVEYVGEAPHSAYFCGRLEPLTVLSENQDVPVAEAPGIATAEFGVQRLPFGTPSLFVTWKPETMGDGELLTAVTDNDSAFGKYVAAAQALQPVFADWYGTEGPLEPMRLIDHRGQPFTDGALAVTDLGASESGPLSLELADGLSHAWMPVGLPWVTEGLGQFFRLLWLERTGGRERAVAELEREATPLALAEPASGGGPGQPLIEARDEVYLRNKAAAVWWMLRSVVGDDILQAGLRSYRRESKSNADTHLLERLLEQKAGTSLQWFFDDWVYTDKGLPDLSIVQVTPRELPAQGGKEQGWLVAVAVKNDGDAVAEVPVTVRSGTLAATERLRVAGRSTASTRIVFQKAPEEVQVNDGEVPEVRTSVHLRRVTIAER